MHVYVMVNSWLKTFLGRKGGREVDRAGAGVKVKEERKRKKKKRKREREKLFLTQLAMLVYFVAVWI